MRAIHKTNIFFGNQYIPVKISTVVREAGTGMSNACPHCKGDVGHINRCKDCGEEIPFADIRKAYKVSNDEKHIFAKEQLYMHVLSAFAAGPAAHKNLIDGITPNSIIYFLILV